ncbi:MAG: double-strand break repair protein AddB [Pseudomonadota bacterium]
MFEPSTTPRVFGLSPGVDFTQALVDGLTPLIDPLPPEQIAKIQIFVNTSRMRRRLKEVFDAGPPRLLPRIRLITDLARDPISEDSVPTVTPLRRRLEIAGFVSALLDQEPDLAPRAALYDLADSLARLMDEMQGEGVTPADIAALDVSDQSGHWDRALRFLSIITPYFSSETSTTDEQARQRRVIEALDATWRNTPPNHPIIVAGSTGSRGATGILLQSVARLPQGAVVLPGFDFDLPDHVWCNLGEMSEDHPQYRFGALLQQLEMKPKDIKRWGTTTASHPARNQLISLSLRPAPVTDQWLYDGPALGDLHDATAGLTLVEAESPRAEAEAIALRLRQAAQRAETAALITPDRMLTRQVAAALDRWDIVPDDSAGTPLQLSPPGRFLRHVLDVLTSPATGETLLALLKHPLCHSGAHGRGEHLRSTREFELALRRRGTPFPTSATVQAALDDTSRRIDTDWAKWLVSTLNGVETGQKQSLKRHLDALIVCAAAFARGQDVDGAGGLWDKAAGRTAQTLCTAINAESDAANDMTAAEFAAFFSSALADDVVRERDEGHPNILIWGTLEARVQGADIVILGGMNEGVWPEAPPPDPWLNRAMRAKAGLLLPERRIGLSAHDYQQAVTGQEVWITRSKRSSDAETVPSRWVNRLTNLLKGLPAQNGPAALEAMQTEGDKWLAWAAQLSEPTTPMEPAARPAPKPPVAARPETFSVTQIKTLIRDPYAIYADKVLRLRALDPLTPEADAPLKGIIIHGILEEFISAQPDASEPEAKQALLAIAQRHFDIHCPWPTMRALWIAQMARLAPVFLKAEAARQSAANFALSEAWGVLEIPEVGICLTCKADRIDLTPENTALIYDYKTGTVPSKNMQLQFDKQLLAEAVMVERGAFRDLGEKSVGGAAFLGIKEDGKVVPAPLDETDTTAIYSGLVSLFGRWADPSLGFTARTAMFTRDQASDYDHLSRFGEWTMAQPPMTVTLK